MTSERWQQIDQLYHAALELEADQRATFLNQACSSDEDLRREVESLIASHEEAGSFIVEPALKVAAKVGAPARANMLVLRVLSPYPTAERFGSTGIAIR